MINRNINVKEKSLNVVAHTGNPSIQKVKAGNQSFWVVLKLERGGGGDN